MASPKTYNYWIEIFAGPRTWVNLDGDPMHKIVLCVKPSDYSEGATFPIDLRPSAVDESIENFPVNLQPKIPDFSFTINCGYTSPDGSFSTPDLISALEEINRAAGNYFSIIGCRFALVAGAVSDSGQWWDGTFWRDSLSTVASTAPAPATADTAMIVHAGIISDVETDGVDTTTIKTSYPDESCTTGEVVGDTDEDDSIKLLNYSSNAVNEIAVKLANGIIATSDTISALQLYYVPASTAKKYLVLADSYGVTSDGIDLRQGVKRLVLDTSYSFPDSSLMITFTELVNTLKSPSSEYSSKMERYTLVGDSATGEIVRETVAFAKNSEYMVSGYTPHKVDGNVIPFSKFIDGRLLDGSPLAVQVNSTDIEHGLFESSMNGERKYKANLSLTEYPTGVWVDNASIDLVAEYEQLPSTQFVLGKGGHGSIKKFLQDSVSGAPYSKSWTGAVQMPIICYSNEESDDAAKISRARIRVSFDSLKKLEGTVESLRIYISGRFFAHNLTALNTYASIAVRAIKGGAYDVQPGNTFATIQTNIQGERIFSYASGPVYELIKPERYDTLGIDIKQFAEIHFDCSWGYENSRVFDDTDDQLGSFALCGVKIEAVVKTVVEDGDSFIVSSQSSVGGEARSVVNDLYTKFCPAQVVAPSLHSAEVDASINQLEPIRDTVRDVLTSSLVYSERRYDYDSDSAIGFGLKDVWATVLANPVTFSQEYVISTDIPEVFIKNAKITEVYNAYQINWDYDPALKAYSKMLYIDSAGVKSRNTSAFGFDHIVARCQYVDSIFGTAKRVFKKELRFAADTGAENYIDLISMFLSWPRKTAEVTATIIECSAYKLLDKLTFIGDKFPPALLYRNWIITGMNKSSLIDDGVNTLKLMEYPEWPS